MARGSFCDLTPDVKGEVRSKQRDTNVVQKTLLTELIANSLDAGAMNIALVKTWNTFTIEDDGDGCEDLAMMMKLGASASAQQRGKIGRYGQGFTNSVIRVGKVVSIDTMTAAGVKRHATMNFDDIVEKNSWRNVVRIKPSSSRTSKGTTIACSKPFQGGLTLANWGDFTRDVIRTHFSTAIQRGVKITVNGVTVRAGALPALEQEQERLGDYGDAQFKATFGLLKNARNTPSGWNVYWGDLLVMENYTGYGFDGFSPTGFWGRIELTDGEKTRYNLSTKKDDVDELPAILDYLAQFVRPLLEELKEERRHDRLVFNSGFLPHLMNALKTKLAQVREDEKGSHAKEGRRRGAGAAENVGGNDQSKKLYIVDPAGNVTKRMPTMTNIQIDAVTSKARGMGYCTLSKTADGDTELSIFIYADPNPVLSVWDRRLQQHYAMFELAKWVVANPTEPTLGKPFYDSLRLDDVDLCDRIAMVHMNLTETSNVFAGDTLRKAA